MRTEKVIQSTVLLALSDDGLMPFRNTVGKGWVSPPSRTYRARFGNELIKLNKGDVVLRRPSYISWGLAPGSSDIIALCPLVITSHHVGNTIGVFAGIEVKGPAGKELPKQATFRKAVIGAGGIAGVVRSPEDARQLLLLAKEPDYFDR